MSRRCSLERSLGSSQTKGPRGVLERKRESPRNSTGVSEDGPAPSLRAIRRCTLFHRSNGIGRGPMPEAPPHSSLPIVADSPFSGPTTTSPRPSAPPMPPAHLLLRGIPIYAARGYPDRPAVSSLEDPSDLRRHPRCLHGAPLGGGASRAHRDPLE